MTNSRDEHINFREYFRVIIKRRWSIISVFAVIVVTVTINTFTAAPIYEAAARLIIDKENPNVVSIQEVMAVDSSGTDYYQTQYRIIESRTVARDVIKKLNLNESEEFFPGSKDGFISGIIASIKEFTVLLKNSVVALLKKEDTDHHKLTEDMSDYELVSGFIQRISVRPIRNSRLVDISFQGKDPVLVSKIVNTLALAYIDQNLETKLQAVKDAARWLHKRIDEERQKVEKAELALVKYKKDYDIITDFTSGVESVIAQKLAQLNIQGVEAESRRVEAETRYKQAVALKDTPEMLDSIPEVLNNELIKQIKSMEVDLYKRSSEMSKKYGRNHPKMVAIQSEFETLKKRKAYEVNRVVNSLSNEYRVAQAREQSIKEALVNQKNESLDLNQKAIEYGVLKREAESARQMYDLLVNRFKETSLTEDMKTGNIRIIDKAEIPKYSVKPRKKLNILLAVIAGMTAGLGVCFFLEYLDNTIKDPEDIKRYLDIPYLGLVPTFVVDDDNETSELVTVNDPKSTASEAYKGIRTSILFSSAESVPQAILFSSSSPREGKTITSVNLAVAMAQSGSRVIILDCDLRRPKMHKLLDVSRDIGMTNILVGGLELKEAIVSTKVPNLSVIPSGPVPPNPSEILGSNRMAEVIKNLRKDYDRIIIDSPPISAVTDAAVLTNTVDGLILVIRANDKSRDVIISSMEKLKTVNANVLGAVLNDVDTSRNSYYYYQYYYYYGDEGYSHGKKRKSLKNKNHFNDDLL